MVTHLDDDDGGLEVQLLSDIKIILDRTPQYKYAQTSDLLAALNDMEERPWATLHYGKRLDAKRLADLLRPFGITPNNHSFPQTGRKKGYNVADFTDAFERYLTQSPSP